MHKPVVALASLLASFSALAVDPASPLPKEGELSSLVGYSGSVKVLPLGKDRVQVTYEVMGVVVADKGEGLLHNASVRCLGAFLVVNGAFEDEAGSCVYTRPDGDLVFQVNKSTGKLGLAARGTFTLVGGTGRMAGITGGGEFVRTSARPALEGTVQSHARSKGSYKLP